MTIDLYSLVSRSPFIDLYFISFYFFSVIIILNILIAFTIDIYVKIWKRYREMREEEKERGSEEVEMESVLNSEDESVCSDI